MIIIDKMSEKNLIPALASSMLQIVSLFTISYPKNRWWRIFWLWNFWKYHFGYRWFNLTESDPFFQNLFKSQFSPYSVQSRRCFHYFTSVSEKIIILIIHKTDWRSSINILWLFKRFKQLGILSANQQPAFQNEPMVSA